MRDAARLRRDAIQTWHAGVEAVRPGRLVPEWLRVEGRTLVVGDRASSPLLRLALDTIRRVAVVGAGKAGAAMAEAVETALGPELMDEKRLVGWVNVPADCVGEPGGGGQGGQSHFRSGENRDSPQRENRDSPQALERIHLHPARPAGVNEPTPEAVAGAEAILRLVESLGPGDLCLCLISGGGSALLPAPAEGIALADKIAVTRYLSAAGANIEELNTVRKQISRIKGGGLLRRCRAGRLVSLVISDVLGDRLDLIASGPTAPDRSTPEEALNVLTRFHAGEAGIAPLVFEYLHRSASRVGNAQQASSPRQEWSGGRCPPYFYDNFIIGNNGTAVAAAAKEAGGLGYSVTAAAASHCEGGAEDVGRRLAETALEMRRRGGLRCHVSGGEPTVTLVEPSRRGRGGRNQQLMLAALLRLMDDGAEGIALLSGGTDGEDGPTDAAGALLDAGVIGAANRAAIEPTDYLARNDAYEFFARFGGLLKTGSTQTNVCDLRVATVFGGEG